MGVRGAGQTFILFEILARMSGAKTTIGVRSGEYREDPV
jgi:hypothetical protein